MIDANEILNGVIVILEVEKKKTLQPLLEINFQIHQVESSGGFLPLRGFGVHAIARKNKL